MVLYLVQHAEAMPEGVDPSRPLSERGVKDVQRVASYVSRIVTEVGTIFHSNKLRAKQTAEILLSLLKPAKGIAETDGLAPLDSPVIWAERLRDISNSTMLVGHLPHLGRLASLLLCGNSERNIISFKMGGVVCLQRDDSGSWAVQWMITPETVV